MPGDGKMSKRKWINAIGVIIPKEDVPEEAGYTSPKLNKEEVKWLFSLMSGPLHGHFPEEENSHDIKMRRIFWEALYNEIP